MAQVQLNQTTKNDLLLLGTATMFLVDDRDATMREVIDNILSTKPLNSTILGMAFLKEQGPSVDPRYWIHAFITFFVTGLFVAARFYVKRFIVRKLKRDDWFIFAAWLAASFYTILTYIDEVNMRGCRHAWDLSSDEFRGNLKMVYIMEISYVFCGWLVKVCIMGFYWDLVPASGAAQFRFFRRAIFIAFVVLTCIMATALFTVIFQCYPVNFWNNPLKRKCLPLGPLWTVVGALILFSDVIVLILPIRVVWRLGLERRDKAIVTVLFGLGGLSCIADVPRIYYTMSFVDNPDMTFGRCATNIWIELQYCCAIIAVCIPSFKHLVIRCLPALFHPRRTEKTTSVLSMESGRLALAAMYPESMHATSHPTIPEPCHSQIPTGLSDSSSRVYLTDTDVIENCGRGTIHNV